jgi:hypothetical protein
MNEWITCLTAEKSGSRLRNFLIRMQKFGIRMRKFGKHNSPRRLSTIERRKRVYDPCVSCILTHDLNCDLCDLFDLCNGLVGHQRLRLYTSLTIISSFKQILEPHPTVMQHDDSRTAFGWHTPSLDFQIIHLSFG